MNQVPNRIRAFLLGFVTLLSGYLLIVGLTSRKADSKMNGRAIKSVARARDSLRLKRPDVTPDEREMTYTTEGLQGRRVGGVKSSFGMALVSTGNSKSTVPRSYRPLDQIYEDLRDLQSKWPDLVNIEKVGVTTALNEPIWAAKVSDNASEREDEPRILFAGVHHAREPIGSKICLEIIAQLCENYRKDSEITKWVNSIEIWLVPVVNPDGYKYVLENNLTFPWWRKNLRDNDGDGLFNPLYDGVDLNRNYDYNWREGGDGKPSSWFYRGHAPFSELETRAIMNLARRENFVIGISYHSYGESILFPWGNYKRPPDLELIVDIASEMASRIRKESGHGKYSILPLNGRVGQSSIWMYGQLGVIDYIVEVGTEYFPSDETIPFILQENLRGAFYLFDRALDTGIKGHVLDSSTGHPVVAEIEVKELSSAHVSPRKTDVDFGSFYRLLNPGIYTLDIRSQGYLSETVGNIIVQKGEFASLEIRLQRKFDNLSNGTTVK